ncbi:hypothetical protein B484DRAFT_196416 [Ochromonadaceae sp. CCMP2298]|nr:hypothetical protein B484DRAFT_196416 [Ochromonadaceae sp. CCMP2298]
MIGCMFSGRHALSKGEDGYFFIDRDGTHFRHILNFLRSPEGYKCVGVTEAEKEELRRECEYYGIDQLMFPDSSPVITLFECDRGYYTASTIYGSSGGYCSVCCRGMVTNGTHTHLLFGVGESPREAGAGQEGVCRNCGKSGTWEELFPDPVPASAPAPVPVPVPVPAAVPAAGPRLHSISGPTPPPIPYHPWLAAVARLEARVEADRYSRFTERLRHRTAPGPGPYSALYRGPVPDPYRYDIYSDTGPDPYPDPSDVESSDSDSMVEYEY